MPVDLVIVDRKNRQSGQMRLRANAVAHGAQWYSMATAIPKRQIVRLLGGSALVCALAPAQSLEYRLEAMDVRIPTLESGRLTLAFDGQLDVGVHALAHSALGGLGDLQ